MVNTENASQYLAKFSKLVRLILENAEGTSGISWRMNWLCLNLIFNWKSCVLKERSVTIYPLINPSKKTIHIFRPWSYSLLLRMPYGTD